MFNIIYSEFLKLKKSYILAIALIGGVLLPGIQFASAIGQDFSDGSQEQIQIFIEDRMVNIEDVIISIFIYYNFCFNSRVCFYTRICR